MASQKEVDECQDCKWIRATFLLMLRYVDVVLSNAAPVTNAFSVTLDLVNAFLLMFFFLHLD